MSHPWFLQISWAWLGLSHQSTLPLLAALGDHAHITEQGEHVETKLVEVCTVSKHHGEKGGGFHSGLCCIVHGPAICDDGVGGDCGGSDDGGGGIGDGGGGI